MEKFGFIYLWYDRKRKMYYIGSHWGGQLDDGYICSSNRMRKSYRRRPQDFKRRILEKLIGSRRELLEVEEKWLKRAERRKHKHYNQCFNAIVTEYTRKNKKHYNIWNKGKHLSEEHKQKMKDAWVKRKEIPFLEETRQKMSLARKGKPLFKTKGRKLSDEHKKKISEGLTGRVISDETKKKISESNKGKKFYGNQYTGRKKYYGEDDY